MMEVNPKFKNVKKHFKKIPDKCDPDSDEYISFCMDYFRGKCPRTCFYATYVKGREIHDRRARSVGLETEVHLTIEDFEMLKNHPLRGRLGFREVGGNSTRREIPFTIICSETQEEFLEVEIFPRRTYFGGCTKNNF